MKSTKPLKRQEILSLLQKNQDALKKYKVKKIGLFGSYAKGKQEQRSDIDFLVEFEEPTLNNFMNLAEYLEKLLGKKIDLLTNEGVESIRVKTVADSIKRSVLYV